MSTDSIKVALRVRPLLPHELNSGSRSCVQVLQSVSQVQIKGVGVDEAFTYNYVYGSHQDHNDVFSSSVKPLIPQLFKGYNVTVLAYGQTGSGKTYSMGTNCGTDGGTNKGVIPMSVQNIFNSIEKSPDCKYTVSVSFLELYNEQIRDLLLDSSSQVSTGTLEVREDTSGNVCIPGLSHVEVSSVEETMNWLAKGSQFRSTGATAMNKTSSRSHAVFTVNIECSPLNGGQATVAKFCLVDLAGSERAKKTQSTGDRFREGVNINMGLLALGNVISALGDENQRRGHIPYRDSKLTRLLQDSLGGNSYTLMIACVSPADSNLNESLNTMRYADRARRIKNKPTVNADPKTAEIGLLQSKINHITQLLAIERAKGPLRKCPPGHQRLIDIVRAELAGEEESSFIAKIKLKSPRTKTFLRQVGIPLSEDEEEEEEDVVDASNEMKVKLKPLFPQPQGLSPYNEEEEEKEDEAEMENEYQMFQANLGSELEKVDLELERKVALMSELADAAEIEEKYFQMENQLKELKQEKKKLESTLLDMQKHNPKVNAHLAEQRRLMIRDLERRIAIQKKQLIDQERLRQEKKRDSQKISNLNNEIQSLKQAKVRLTREIKKSADNYRSWKQRQDREVGRLQEAERKGRNQLDKQSKLHSRQQAVLQRKYEEAMASNKRMQAILQRRTANVTTVGHKNAAEAAEKIHNWLDHELEVERNLTFTRETLDQINAEVTMYQEKVKELQSSTCWEDKKSKNQRMNKTREYNDRIRAGRSQINELEHKLVGVEICDVKSPHSRWAGVTNLSDARIMLHHLFTSVVSSDHTIRDRNDRIAELESENISLKQENKNLIIQINEMEKKNKIALSQSPNQMKPPNGFLTPKASSQDNRAQAVTTILKNRKKSLFANPVSDDDEEEEEEEDFVLDNSTNDPDWKKTPMFRRQKRSAGSNNSSDNSNRCCCKGKCDTKRCKCVKNSGSCGENCNCKSDQCQNRVVSISESETPQDLNATFVLPNSCSTPISNGSMSSLKRDSADMSEDNFEDEVPKKRKLFTQTNFN